MKDIATIKVPATTANLGPAFDSLGMALDVWNSICVEVGPFDFVVSGEGADELPKSTHSLLYKSFCVPFSEVGQPVPNVSIKCHNKIPISRGLGSSAAAIVGGLLAANELCETQLSRDKVLDLAVKIEGHPDNVTAALLGGCQIVVNSGSRCITSEVPVSESLSVIIFIPDVNMSTADTRKQFPTNVSRQDAIFNIGRVALLIKALSTGDLTHLATATKDRLHQPMRQKLFPPIKNIISAAIEAGASGAFLSGSGSSVIALAQERELSIGCEMSDAAAKSGVTGTLKITRPTNKGAHVVQQN